MAYKDLQVHVDSTANCDQRLHVAAGMATNLDAHLTGVYVRPKFHLPSYMTPMDTEWMRRLEASYEQEMDAKERDAKQVFDDVISQYSVDAAWQTSRGTVYASLAEEAAYADLMVLGQPDSEDVTNQYQDLPDQVVLTTGRPCLVVPYIGADNNVGKHPLVAWNGTRESNRALHDALPLLERAETVTIMLSEESGQSGNADLPDTRIAQHLARHDVKVMTKTLRAKKSETSNVFLSYLADNGHDLLIMGAYGHSRLREVVLGGMTREIMKTMTVPVLMSH